MEQPMADIEEEIKNWERIKSIEEKNQEEPRFERNSRRKTDRGDKTGACECSYSKYFITIIICRNKFSSNQ